MLQKIKEEIKILSSVLAVIISIIGISAPIAWFFPTTAKILLMIIIWAMALGLLSLIVSSLRRDCKRRPRGKRLSHIIWRAKKISMDEVGNLVITLVCLSAAIALSVDFIIKIS